MNTRIEKTRNPGYVAVRVLFAALLLGALNPATAFAAQVLIYGPSLDTSGETDAQTVAEGEGHTVTVFDSGQWAAASAATFGSFDAIVIDDAACDGDESLLDAAFANDGVWGPEITGNAVLHTFDPGAHASSFPQGVTLLANGINWAASGGGTGFYMSTGCYFASDAPGSFEITGLGIFGFDGDDGDMVVIQNSGHPVMAGLTNGGLSNWGDSVHAHFTGVPVGFDVLAVEQEDQTPDAVILARGGMAGAPRATFEVNKDFNDNNPAEVEVTISCNTGLPLQQTTSISDGDGVVFVVRDFNDGELDCEITEAVPGGYAPSYFNGSVVTSGSCEHNDVTFGQASSCTITNTLQSVDVEVTKEWIDENPQFQPFNVAQADYFCSNEVFFQVSGELSFSGNPDTESFSVFPNWNGSTTCTVTESFLEGGVEADDSDCQSLSVTPGSGASCTIVNTRLFEGIPTLSQYGLTLLAMLMLGIGLVAFRRMA